MSTDEYVESLERQVDALKADQNDWRKGVGLIAGMLGMETLACVPIAERALELQAKLEAAEARLRQCQEAEAHLREKARLRGGSWKTALNYAADALAAALVSEESKSGRESDAK